MKADDDICHLLCRRLLGNASHRHFPVPTLNLHSYCALRVDHNVDPQANNATLLTLVKNAVFKRT